MSLPRVALMGFYGHGNFGDDAMAVLLGRFLRQAGIPFSVYRLCEAYAAPNGFRVARSPEELLEDADVLLWGGGGLLVPWSNLLYRVLFPGVAGAFDNLVKRAIQKGHRLMACSVGGDGSCPQRLTPGYKELFARAASFMTVRNPQDLAILQRLGIPGGYFPDLMWLACEGMPLPPRRADGLRIAFDLYPSHLLRRFAAYLLPVLAQLTRARRDCQFFFLDSTNQCRKPYRGLGMLIRGPNVRSHQFSAPDDDLRFLASLDLLVSSRLHTPVAALQCGVPAISLLAEKKTTLLYHNLGLQRFCFGHRGIGELYRLVSRKPALEELLRGFPFPDIQALRAGAAGHLRVLHEQLVPGTP